MAIAIQLSVSEIEARLLSFFKDRKEILLAYLFGSFVQAETRIPEDLDLAVLADPLRFQALDRKVPYGYHSALTTAVMGLLKYNRIDLTLLHQATPLLTYRVIHT